MSHTTTSRDTLLDVTFELIYIHGYSATSIGAILKAACVPKGSLYHHFKSKKELVLCMIKERLFPKMDLFFNFEYQADTTVYERLQNTFTAISHNHNLIHHGCPLYRLMVELAPVDKDFEELLNQKYDAMVHDITILLEAGIKHQQIASHIIPKTFAPFLITSVWGILSLSPSRSSQELFIQHTHYLLSLIEK